MPVYEYTCEGCGNTFERSESVDNRDVPCFAPCSQCDGDIVRGTGCAGFQLKGSCWERDGYFKRRKP